VNLQKKVGPLPVWAWGLILGIGVYYLYRRNKQNQQATTATTSNPGVLDPNAVDPNTGLTYGQEESAALNANAASAGGTVGTYPTSSGLDTSLQSSASDLSSLDSLLQEFGVIAADLGYVAPNGASSNGATSPSVPASSTSTTGQNASNSPPMQAQASPPSNKAAANTPHVTPSVPVMTGAGSAPWQNQSFFTLTLGQVINTFRSPEATARYLFAKGYRPQGVNLNPKLSTGPQSFAAAAGETWVYVGPAGKSQLPQVKYTISKAG
jgi:hypothetical protein